MSTKESKLSKWVVGLSPGSVLESKCDRLYVDGHEVHGCVKVRVNSKKGTFALSFPLRALSAVPLLPKR